MVVGGGGGGGGAFLNATRQLGHLLYGCMAGTICTPITYHTKGDLTITKLCSNNTCLYLNVLLSLVHNMTLGAASCLFETL